MKVWLAFSTLSRSARMMVAARSTPSSLRSPSRFWHMPRMASARLIALRPPAPAPISGASMSEAYLPYGARVRGRRCEEKV